MIFRAKAPLRLGFAGGGTDLEPFASENGGAILNATINKYAYATLVPKNNGQIVFNQLDRNIIKSYKSETKIKFDDEDILLAGAYNEIVNKFTKKPLSFELSTYVDAPPGSGLGSSSTLMVTILKVFSLWLKIPLGDYDLAYLAYEIERKKLFMSGGKQDQYAATFGGFNFMEFYSNDKVIVNPLRINLNNIYELEHNILLYFTGKSRYSSDIIDSQTKNIKNKNIDSVKEMNNIKDLAYELKNNLLIGDIDSFGPILHKGWISKKNTANQITNDEIDSVYQSALDAGSTGGKVSGAGGGGFFIFYCPNNTKYNVIKSLSKFNGTFNDFQFSKYGADSWKK